MANVLVNTAKWNIKKKSVMQAIYPVSIEAVKEASDFVYRETKKNVAGSPSAAPQTKPVPRRSTRLFRSIKREVVNPVKHRVYSDTDVAPHNIYVHYGTRKMRPRRFLGDVLTKYSRKIYTQMNKVVEGRLRKIGRI